MNVLDIDLPGVDCSNTTMFPVSACRNVFLDYPLMKTEHVSLLNGKLVGFGSSSEVCLVQGR